MTATPSPSTEWDSAWREHTMNVAAVGEVAEQADGQMKKLIRTLRAYRMHKNRCTTETEVDFGVVAEVILELERTVGEC